MKENFTFNLYYRTNMSPIDKENSPYQNSPQTKYYVVRPIYQFIKMLITTI